MRLLLLCILLSSGSMTPVYGQQPKALTNSIGMKLVSISPGSFTMGCPIGGVGRYDTDTQHEVTISKPYYLGVYEVTQEQYEKVMSNNPSRFKGSQLPAEQVYWNDAVAFCKKLSEMPEEKADEREYRLPTEAEWEYACRAGSTTKYSFGDSAKSLGEYAWFSENSEGKTHRVGLKKTNKWGLHDMHGNVVEWCQDRFGLYPSGAATDPQGPSVGAPRVLRGGSWYVDADTCQSQYRSGADSRFLSSFDGFRVALRQVPKQIANGTDIKQVPKEITNGIGMKLVLIPAGSFTMGEPPIKETPHEVTITKSYHLGAYEVTQDQYEKVMGSNPSHFKGAKNPVEKVYWEDAVSFCKKLSELPEEKAAGREYRLPTEAEWEYVCRAGSTTAYSFGDTSDLLGEYAWFGERFGSSTHHPVGEKKPNQWGLYDMHGNVFEWCQDWFEPYQTGAATDPQGPIKGTERVLRGGSWVNDAMYCRAARRVTDVPWHHNFSFGFRVAMSQSGK